MTNQKQQALNSDSYKNITKLDFLFADLKIPENFTIRAITVGLGAPLCPYMRPIITRVL